MNTPKSACKAKNPEFCRYHSSKSEDYNTRTEKSYNFAKEMFNKSSGLQERYENERYLNEAESEYASTDVGREHFAKLHDESDDPIEQERLKNLIEEGERLREYVEDKADGVIKFPASKLEIAEKRIATANRKLERAGVEERFTYTTEEYIEKDKDGNAYNMVALSLSHPKLSQSGWSFIAAVDKTEDGSMVTRSLPSQELNGYRPEAFQCDHCGSNRRRKSTYLLRNEEGEVKQVGSNCLKSFLGVEPRALWALNYDPEEGDEFVMKSGSRRYGDADTAMPTTDLVAAALAVSEGGEKYVSKKAAYEWGMTATVTDIQNYFFSPNRKNWEGIDHNEFKEQAQQLLDNTKFDGDDDYNTNMRTLLSQEYTSMKHMGYVASVIAAHKRQQGQAERVAKASVKAVGYLGKPKEKLADLRLKIKTKFVSESSYNGVERTSTLLIMEDELGRQVKWNASGYKDVKEGDDITIKSATIKGVDMYNGNEQTIITRARIAEPEPEVEGETK